MSEFRKLFESSRKSRLTEDDNVFGQDWFGNSITAANLEGSLVSDLIDDYPNIKFDVMGSGDYADKITKIAPNTYKVVTDDPEVNNDLMYVKGYIRTEEDITYFKELGERDLRAFFDKHGMNTVTDSDIDSIIQSLLKKLPKTYVLKNMVGLVCRVTKSDEYGSVIEVYAKWPRVGTFVKVEVPFPLK